MIRLQPTAIGLGHNDIREYGTDRRIDQHNGLAPLIKKLSELTLAAGNYSAEIKLDTSESLHRKEEILASSPQYNENFPEVADPQIIKQKDEIYLQCIEKLGVTGLIFEASTPAAENSHRRGHFQNIDTENNSVEESSSFPKVFYSRQTIKDDDPCKLSDLEHHRKHRRYSDTVFRHQKNSFSFGSSERNSTTFDEGEQNAKSSYELTSHISDKERYHIKMQHKFLVNPEVGSHNSHNHESLQTPDPNERFSRSPDIPILRFQLPPPFSSTSRYFSRPHSQSTWAKNDFELTPIESFRKCLQIQQESEPSGIQSPKKVTIQHEIPEYIATFPVGTPPESNNFTQIEHQNRSFSNVGALARSYQVYNDEISPSIQPQTPANLPESRHKSRHHPSFSVPTKLFRRDRRTCSINAVNATGRHYRRGTSSSHSPGNGVISPSEMVESSNSDLFGGRENEDDELNWVQGMGSNSPRLRLWRQEDSGSNERELDRTPKSEHRIMSHEF